MPRLVAHGVYLGVTDRGKAVRRDGKPCHAERHKARNVGVMQRHLDLFIGVFVVHVVDDVHRIDIQPAKPRKVNGKTSRNFIIVERIARKGLHLRADMPVEHIVIAAVDRQQQQLRKIAARAEKLHLFAHLHGGDTAGDGVIIAVDGAHQVVVFVLNGVGVHGDARAERLKRRGQFLRPKHRQVRLRRGAERIQRVEYAVGILCDKRPAVQALPADAFGDPHRVAAEQLVVFGCAQVPRHTQLQHEVVHQFLRAAFGQRAVSQVAFDINVQECRGAPQGHRRAVLLLDRGKVAEIQPLDRLARVRSGRADVVAVQLCHFLEQF